MTQPPASPPPEDESPFARAARAPRTGLLAETWTFLRQERRYWLAPVVVLLLLLGALVLLSGTAAAPFIYTLF